jgi:sugar-specific transcriptional regulator TrmB
MLRDLGLTGTEAEVYFAALQACGSEPVSSYRLAQLMGRDPANIAKTIGSLVRQQAMSVIQDKPRLFQPAEPAAFAEHVQARLKRRSKAAVELLGRCHAPLPEGLTQGLATTEQVYLKARELLAGCRRRVLVFGSKEALREIGAELEAAADSPGCAVQVLSPVAMIAENVEITVFDGTELSQLEGLEFLHLVVDDRAWLSARLDAEPDSRPTGWWGDQTPMAGVLGACLALARQGCLASAPSSLSMPDSDGPPAAGPEPAPPAVAPAEVVATTMPEKLPPPPPPAPAEPEFEEGLTFLLRHADRETSAGDADAKKKGEP